jgi:hypothetical protein
MDAAEWSKWSAIAAIASAGAAVILTGLTAWYAHVTRKASKFQRDAFDKQMEFQRNSFQQQLEAQRMPELFVELASEGDVHEHRVRLNVINAGTVPAYDVDIWVVPVFHTDECSVDQFFRRFLGPQATAEHERVKANLVDDGFYGVRQRYYYAAFPHNRQVAVPVRIPLPTISTYVLIQFRSALGTNYARAIYFSAVGGIRPGERFRLSSIEPPGQQAIGRIDLEHESSTKFPFLKEFLVHYRASYSYGSVTETLQGPEDVGTWSAV